MLSLSCTFVNNSQLRYNDSIFYLEKALKTFPENYRLERALAIRYLTANKIEKALFLFKKIYEKTDDKLDITYRIGLAYFYLKQYNFAKEYFLISLNLSEKNKEMYIACIYWLLLTNVQLKESINETLNNYHDFFVTHHAGYEYAVHLFLNEPLSDYEEISKSDNLTRVMFLFGLYHFYLYKNDTKKAEETFSLGLKCDEYWASFSGKVKSFFKNILWCSFTSYQSFIHENNLIRYITSKFHLMSNNNHSNMLRS